MVTTSPSIPPGRVNQQAATHNTKLGDSASLLAQCLAVTPGDKRHLSYDAALWLCVNLCVDLELPPHHGL